MFTNVKSHGKIIKEGVVPTSRDRGGYMFKTSCDIYLSLMREGHVLIPRTVRALQTLALSGGCALLVRTLWAHMLRQDNKD